MFLVLAAAGVLAFGALGGVVGLVALVLGTLLLDVGMQSGMVANQVRIFGLNRKVLSRLNTAYMTCAYLGGSLGSWVGLRAYAWIGWAGVCGLVVVLAGAALGRHLLHRIQLPGGSAVADDRQVSDDRPVADVSEAGAAR
jgi:hypothetical protein